MFFIIQNPIQQQLSFHSNAGWLVYPHFTHFIIDLQYITQTSSSSYIPQTSSSFKMDDPDFGSEKYFGDEDLIRTPFPPDLERVMQELNDHLQGRNQDLDNQLIPSFLHSQPNPMSLTSHASTSIGFQTPNNSLGLPTQNPNQKDSHGTPQVQQTQSKGQMESAQDLIEWKMEKELMTANMTALANNTGKLAAEYKTLSQLIEAQQHQLASASSGNILEAQQHDNLAGVIQSIKNSDGLQQLTPSDITRITTDELSTESKHLKLENEQLTAENTLLKSLLLDGRDVNNDSKAEAEPSSDVFPNQLHQGAGTSPAPRVPPGAMCPSGPPFY
ncbi:hypothetical protein V6N13_117575 [Hibiscus sabdariffa]|uniref:Uncharacterized protein n=1 Tax=Hibiscus sabdariffa TaxID=183260 RepID=A0ABR2PAZ5_9ROSI